MPERQMEEWPAGDLPLTRTDIERFRAALATIARDRTSAEMLLDKIDISPSRLPPFQGSPEQYWFEVFRLLRNGVVDTPCRRLLAVALARYEANAVFRDLHQRYIGGSAAEAVPPGVPRTSRNGFVTWGTGSRLDERTAEFPPAVFLAHSREDIGKVRALATILRAAGFDPWVGQDSVRGGRRWETAVHQAVWGCDFFVPCVSQAALKQMGDLHKEIRLALDRAEELPEDAVFVVPVRLDECEVPWSLTEYRQVDLFAADGADRLLQALRA